MKFVDCCSISELEVDKYNYLIEEAKSDFPNYSNCTGWVNPLKYNDENNLRKIEEAARRIRKDADVFVIIGVGGSNNAARAVIQAFDGGNGPEIIYSGNSNSPAAINKVLSKLEGKSVYINVIAKNFETLEPGISFRVLRQYLYDRYGKDAAKRICATGTRGSHLDDICRKNGWEFFLFPDDIGGRYSMFSDVALLPLAVAGIDIRAYLKGGCDAKEDLLVLNSIALQYAVRRQNLYGKGCKAEILSCFDPRMEFFFKWWVQLFGESEGKHSSGILPVSCLFSEDLHSMGQFLQDGNTSLFETFLMMEENNDLKIVSDGVDDGFDYLNGKSFSDLNSAASTAAYLAHCKHIPCNKLMCESVSEHTFGYLFMFFALVCVFTCRIAGVNPFDQPGVEDYKHEMFRILGK